MPSKFRHLAIDAVGIRHSGGAFVLIDLILAAIANPQVRKISVFLSPHRHFHIPQHRKVVEIHVAWADLSSKARVAWNTWGFAQKARQIHAHCWIAMTGALIFGSPHRSALFLQQSLPFAPEALARVSIKRRLEMKIIKGLMALSIPFNRWVVVQTPTMKSWVLRDLWPFFKIPKLWRKPEPEIQICWPDIRVFPKLTGEVPEILTPMLQTPENQRLFYVGNDSPYKNIHWVIQNWSLLKKRLPELKLFLTWSPDHPLCQNPDVHCLGYLDTRALAWAYRLAWALIQPSLVESGPLTMGEAMASALPVLVADRPYAHDMCEDAALYFDPHDIEDLLAQLLRLQRDKQLRTRLIQRGLEKVQKRRLSKPYRRLLKIMCEDIF